MRSGPGLPSHAVPSDRGGSASWWNASDEEPEADALFGLLLDEAGTY
jgi:hypothetical protein